MSDDKFRAKLEEFFNSDSDEPWDAPDWMRVDEDTDDVIDNPWPMPEWLARIFGPDHHQLRAERMRANGGSHTNQEWLDLRSLYDRRYLCCKRRRKLTKDHVIPVAQGGSDNIDNIQPLCKPCNSRKGARYIDYRRSKQKGDL